MKTFPISVLLFQYLYQYIDMIFTICILLILGAGAFGIYRLAIWKMNERVKKVFHNSLKLAGILILVFFFAEMIFSLITIHLVNKQLGFNYATPDTPKGELFEITTVEPGKIMEKTGLIPGDQIEMTAVDDLYKLLIKNQEKEVVIPVLRDKKKIKIKLKVPRLDVPQAYASFLY